MNYLIYATSNPGKLMEMGKHLASLGIKVHSLKDFGIPEFDVPETGTSLGENAEIKVHAYLKALQDRSELKGNKFLVISDDTGLEIDGLGGQPGIRVRRWKGYRMTDQEINDHALSEMKELKGEQRSAKFRTVNAIGVLGEDGVIGPEVKFFEGTLTGRILEEPVGQIIPGFPFERLFFVPEWGMHLGGAHLLPQSEKDKLLSHRERAIMASLDYIRAEIN